MTSDIAPAEIDARLTAMEMAMGLMLDTMQQQVHLLSEIAEAVRQEPGESPVVTSLDELTQAVVQMGTNVETLAQRFEVLPEELASALNGRGGRIDPTTGRRLTAIVPRDAPGLTITDDLSSFGQRNTASGTVTLEDVFVADDGVLPIHRAQHEPIANGAVSQIMQAGIDSGIAVAAFTDTRAIVRSIARQWRDSGQKTCLG